MISPRFPSWIRSRKSMPLPTYLFAIETTSLRFASASAFFASSSPFSIRFASSISSSAVRRGTLPISLRYIRTGSSMLTPSTSESMSIFSTPSSSVSARSSALGSPISKSSMSAPIGSMGRTSTPFFPSISITLSTISSSSVTFITASTIIV